jgi:hypothetical protein
LKWLERTYSSDHKTELVSLFNRTSLAELMKIDRLDYCGAMGNQFLEGLIFQGKRALTEEDSLLCFVADYIVNRQSRLPDGTFWRPEAGQTLWIDDLYMSCPFLVRWYQYTGDMRHLDDAARQIIQMSKRQQDTDGLWYHVNFISELWEETSCSAMFAYSIARAVRRGWIGTEYLPFARKAFEGVSGNVTENGLVNGTCEGTGIGTDLNFYINRRRPSNDAHGIGPVLLAGTELMLADSSGYVPAGPWSFTIGRNFPNPFKFLTRIPYSIQDPGPVEVFILDIRGRKVAILSDGIQSPGTYWTEWNGTDDAGSVVPSGTYLIRIVQGNSRQTIKAVFIR